jgi:DNA-binding NarL/FixJ family response regulator
MNKIEVVIADDHSLIRLGLKNILAQNKDIFLVGEFDNGKDTLNYILDNTPDIAILDIDMPKMNGLKVCEQVRLEKIRTKIIFLTMLNEESVLNKAKALGANGFILKNFATDELNQAIESVLDNEFYIGKNVRENLSHKPSILLQNERINELLSRLTSTEKQILLLIAQNFSSKQISEKMFLAESTIRKNRQNITKKLDLESEQGSLLKFAHDNKNYL